MFTHRLIKELRAKRLNIECWNIEYFAVVEKSNQRTVRFDYGVKNRYFRSV